MPLSAASAMATVVVDHLEAAAVRVLPTPDRGRVVVATAALPPGTLACAVAPFAAVVTDGALATTCHHCLGRIPAQQVDRGCAGCGVARYCSEACEVAAGPGHEPACAGLRKLRLLQLLKERSDNLRLLLAVLARRRLELLAAPPLAAGAGELSFADVLALEENAAAFELVRAHRPPPDSSARADRLADGASFTSVRGRVLQEPAARQEQIRVLCKVAGDLAGGEASDRLGVDQIVGLFRRLQCNSHAVTDPTGQAVGVGLYPCLGSAFNHACRPNCAVHFQLGGQTKPVAVPPALLVRAAAGAAAEEELTIGYCELYALPAVRNPLATCSHARTPRAPRRADIHPPPPPPPPSAGPAGRAGGAVQVRVWVFALRRWVGQGRRRGALQRFPAGAGCSWSGAVWRPASALPAADRGDHTHESAGGRRGRGGVVGAHRRDGGGSRA